MCAPPLYVPHPESEHRRTRLASDASPQSTCRMARAKMLRQPVLTLPSWAILIYTTLVAATCDVSRPIALCCMGVAPWDSNEGVWGGICGYYPSNPSTIVGARCIPFQAAGCPVGNIGTCCAGQWSSGQCGLGTDCSGSPSAPSSTTTSSSTPTPTPPPPLPDGWTLASACAQDSSSRILSSDVSANLPNNTPNNCIAHCQALGYVYAGVEYGNQCRCGTGFSAAPSPIDPSNCHKACSGDAQQTCGGSYAIQLYQGPAVTEPLPAGWTVAAACAVDNASRVIVKDKVTILPNNTPATCIQHCISAGSTYAGVEYGDECHCGTGYAEDAGAPTTDCSKSCPGNPALTCGGSWRIQIYLTNT
ncbi:WSC-domain-containing protein [Phanerochaete sordida]|uniref:WSC-domain-containing protein n=1 Tax=Phanerochaete sordida TaxID=48140 RepID=A0A9P3G3G9_9APHY|nr:WSC-domain-containing protein [Phanerochaete sordida]